MPATGLAYNDPLELMKQKSNTWSRLWSRDEDRMKRMVQVYDSALVKAKMQDVDSSLFLSPRISSVVKTCRSSRATSLDSLAIKDFKNLPVEAFDDLSDVIQFIVVELALPTQILLPSVSLIPKPSGGDRPITVTSVL